MLVNLRHNWEQVAACLLILAAGIWRLALMDIFAGWEESDYGNLAMVRGVYESTFLIYDMNHMPGYYGLAALGLFLTEDTVLAAKMCSWLGGMLAYIAAVFWTRYWVGWKPALLVAVLLFAQAEFSLYSASALREPIYAAAMMGVLWGASSRSPTFMVLSAVLAFSVRFEAPVALFPLLILLYRRPRFIIALGAGLSLAVLCWAFYCMKIHGTYQFWGHATEVNVETGLGSEALSKVDWLKRGSAVSLHLLAWLLPWRIGWGVWLGAILSPFVLLNGEKGRQTFVLGAGLTLVWLGIGAVAQHEPGHNLYWKWLYPLVPFWIVLGVCFWWRWLQRFPNWLQWSCWFLILGQAVFSHVQESQRQIERSQSLYAPQVALAHWVEQQNNTNPLVFDNIPACWMNRKPNDFELISWFDIPTDGTEQDFSNWLIDQNVWGVLWFAEEWTQSPKVAPFLANGDQWCHQELCLQEHSRGDEYGWIFYLVEHH